MLLNSCEGEISYEAAQLGSIALRLRQSKVSSLLTYISRRWASHGTRGYSFAHEFEDFCIL